MFITCLNQNIGEETLMRLLFSISSEGDVAINVVYDAMAGLPVDLINCDKYMSIETLLRNSIVIHDNKLAIQLKKEI
jgi:hypothetical protein